MEQKEVSNTRRQKIRIDKKDYFVIILGTLSEYSDNMIWRHSHVVRQRSATPLSPVQIWLAPSKNLVLRNEIFLSIATAMAYHHALACISSTRQCRVVSHHTVGVYQKTVGLMIYTTSF